MRSTPGPLGPAEGHPPLLMDRRAPEFPEVYGELFRKARSLDVAAWRIRLAGLHLPHEDLLRKDRIRVVVGELDGQRLADEAEAMALRPGRLGTVRALLSLLLEDRLLVRCAPLGGWSPDFSLFGGVGTGPILLMGPHWLERPFLHRGPALASLHRGGAALAVALRFEELWREAHDVRAAVLRMLSEAARRSGGPVAP